MLYAIQDKTDRTIICAADTADEFATFVDGVEGTASSHHTDAYFTSPFDLLSDPFFSDFRRSVLIVEHQDRGARTAYAETTGITVVAEPDGKLLHDRMMNGGSDGPADPYADGVGQFTISQMHGLEAADPWDKRTDAEREEDEKYRKLAEEAKKGGKLTSDSFGPKKPEGSSVHVSDVRATTHADGTVTIDDVLAHKWEGEEETPKAETADDENLAIDPDGLIAIYHKVEVTGCKLSEIEPVLTAGGFDLEQAAVVRRNNASGCWAALPRQSQAEQVTGILVAQGIEAEAYAVNDRGERLLPKGIKVVEDVVTEEPRLWNSRAAEIAGMDEEATKAWRKGIKGDEFLFTGSYDGPRYGCTVWIVPRSYFTEHEAMYPHPLDIGHLLPPDLKEIEPGVYRSESRSEWQQLDNALTDRGLRQSMLLQIHLNNL